MRIQLSEHFDFGKLLRFTFPSIIMMIFTSVYGVVDGFFISNIVGATPFAAVNLIMPFLYIFGAVGFMIGTGGSALVSLKIGQGKKDEANQIFSLLIYVLIGLGLAMTVFGEIFLRPIGIALGASDEMIGYCVTYGRITLMSLVPFMLQYVFQSFMVTAERPKMGLMVTIAAGVTNMGLDALFMAGFHWGVAGAALATSLSQCVGGFIPLIYFFLPNSSNLRLGRTRWMGRAVLRACANGSSEFMTNIAGSVVSMLYNFQLMKIAGESGVAAYGVIMYVNFIFLGVFIGYSVGSSPIVSCHYGAGGHSEVRNILKKSLTLTTVFAVILTVTAELAAKPLSLIFVSYDEQLLNMTIRAFHLYAFSFLIAGFNIYGSSFFTALNDGMTSALISFGRTLVFQVISVLILPLFLGIDGIWLASVLAEALALILTAFCFIKLQDKYHYGRERISA